MPELATDGFWIPSAGEGRYSLPQSKKDANANKIYQYFHNNGWSDNAIYAMLGNIDVESRQNPQCLAGTAFGLVQWDPRTKLDQWAGQAGLPSATELGTVQMGVILWQQQNEIGWDRKDESDVTFYDYSRDTTTSMQRMVHLWRWLFEVADPETEPERLQWALYYQEHIPFAEPVPKWLLFKMRRRRDEQSASHGRLY